MNVMILGPAGCGKSSLTGHFGSYLLGHGGEVRFLNLDPGCIELPYRCDFDIRDMFTVEKIMREERLGPGGAMTRAMELLSRTEIPRNEADFVLIDTPGQLEVFAFHKSGPNIVNQFANLVGLFILDASIGIADIPAAYLYSLATGYRLGIDTINVINKVDLLEKRDIEELERYLRNPAALKNELRTKGVMSDIYVPLSELMQKIIPSQRNPSISAKLGTGFDELYDILREVRCACGDLS